MSARLAMLLLMLAGLFATAPATAEDWVAKAKQQTIELPRFAFHTGEILPAVKMHVYTLGTPHRDARGRIDNAVMLLHGTGGDGTSLLRPSFGDQLFENGQLLDTAKHYVISPDNLGHGESSKPSDGLRLKFPHYDYDDMVQAEYRMLTEGLKVDRLQLILGTSMGCMQAFVWGYVHPGFSRRLVPLACNVIEIGGRNRMFRQMAIDGFERDPAYRDGNYADPAKLVMGQAIFQDVLLIAGSNPYQLQTLYPTREASVARLHAFVQSESKAPVDPNDTIYQFDSSRDYNPKPHLAEIKVPVLWINSADDFINPPSLGDPANAAKLMPKARFVLIPLSDKTHGHGTHSAPQFWKGDLARFLKEYP